MSPGSGRNLRASLARESWRARGTADANVRAIRNASLFILPCRWTK
jgi:hypothetical protein